MFNPTQKDVYQVIRDAGMFGLTSREVADKLGMSSSSLVDYRIGVLKRLGIIRGVGRKSYNGHGPKRILWRAVE